MERCFIAWAEQAGFLLLRTRGDVTLKDKLTQETIRVERDQLSHGRLIHVVSVFPQDGTCTPEDKVKTLIDMDLKKEKQCA